MTHDFSQRVLSRKFVLQRRIGVGGMATVYEATNITVGKRLAVKVLHPEFITHDTLQIRFRQEARSVAQLEHPHIVAIHDYDVDEGLPYIVMEYLEGMSLSELLHRNEEPLSWRRVADMCAQVCAALHYAHQRRLFHRDIKPSNVFLVEDPERPGDTIKLLDFGIAKVHQLEPHEPNPITRPSQIPGTPEYMAPEQAQGQPCDGRTDIYAVGVMMFRLLTGKLPFYAPTPTETLAQHVLRPPPSMRAVAPHIDLPAELEAIVLRALAKHPDQRWESAMALREALLELIEDRQPTLAPPRPRLAAGTPTVGTRAVDASATPGWITLHAFESRDRILRVRRIGTMFSGVSLGLGAFMFFSLFPLPGVALLAGGTETPPPSESPRRAPPPPPPPPLIADAPRLKPPPPPPVSAPAPVPVPAESAPPPGDDLIVIEDPGAGPPTPPPEPHPAPNVRPPAPQPPVDPKRNIEGHLKRKKAAFRDCSAMIPFGDTVTLRVDMTLEPSTGRALEAVVKGDLRGKSYAVCAVDVLKKLKYPRYVGPGELADVELKL